MPSYMEEETHNEVKEAAEMQQKLSWAKIFFFVSIMMIIIAWKTFIFASI